MSTDMIEHAFAEPSDADIDALKSALHRIFAPTDAYTLGLPPDLSLAGAPAGEVAAVIDDVTGRLLPSSVFVRHRRAIAHMVPPPATVAVLADAIIGALNQCAFIAEEAPLAAAIEREVIDWMRQRLELDGGGILTSGGTESNALAMRLALERALAAGYDRSTLSVVTTDQAHFSVEKASVLLGLGAGAVHRVPVDDRGHVVAGSIDRAACSLEAAQRHPFLFICTAGTTSCGTVEPASPFLEAAAQRSAWTHVDAAYGGLLSLTECPTATTAWREADSVSWDPHKTLYVSLATGALFLRDVDALRLFDVPWCYSASRDSHENAGQLHFAGSRRFEALKLWMTIRYFGVDGLRAVTERTVSNARTLSRLLRAIPEIAVVVEPETNIVVFTVADDELTELERDSANRSVQQELFYGAGPLISVTQMRGRVLLRAVLLNPLITAPDIQDIADRIAAQARQVLAEMRERRMHHEDRTRYQPAS